MSINYGKIYQSTWFGNTQNSNNFGLIYDNLVFSESQIAFQNRVEADGGFIESLSCLSAF